MPYQNQFITELKRNRKKKITKSPFFVADIESILNDCDEHTPYAIGLYRCLPESSDECLYDCSKINREDVHTWYSEDYLHIKEHSERSTRMLSSFMHNLENLVRKDHSCKVVYFHNFAHFDGIMLTRHLVKYHNYKLTPIMINGELYELRVYYNQRHSIVFRDSLKQVGKSAERSVSSCRLRNKECYNKECSEIKPSLV